MLADSEDAFDDLVVPAPYLFRIVVRGGGQLSLIGGASHRRRRGITGHDLLACSEELRHEWQNLSCRMLLSFAYLDCRLRDQCDRREAWRITPWSGM